MVGCAAGALVGDPEIGLIAAVAITPLASLTSAPSTGAALAGAAAIHGAVVARLDQTPGIIVPPFLGAAWGGLALLLLALLPASRRLPLALLLAGAIAVGPCLAAPTPTMVALAPWLAGGLFVAGLGAIAGRRPGHADAAALATVITLLLTNIAAQVGLVGVLVGVALRDRTLGRGGRLVTAGLALVAALWLAWIPHQLGGWPSPGIPLPSGFVPVTLPPLALVLPLFAVGALASTFRGSRS